MTSCPDEEIAALSQALEKDNNDGAPELDALLSRYPDDPRLHFLQGSIHAATSNHVLAHKSLSRAVELAPDFHIARYQLGFFELTSGEADAALSTWGQLLRLSDQNYLRHFVEGITHLIRDEFDAALGKMQSGIALNQENEPLNNDIRLLMEQTEKLMSGNTVSADYDSGSDDQSATSILLGQFGSEPTKH